MSIEELASLVRDQRHMKRAYGTTVTFGKSLTGSWIVIGDDEYAITEPLADEDLRRLNSPDPGIRNAVLFRLHARILELSFEYRWPWHSLRNEGAFSLAGPEFWLEA